MSVNRNSVGSIWDPFYLNLYKMIVGKIKNRYIFNIFFYLLIILNTY